MENIQTIADEVKVENLLPVNEPVKQNTGNAESSENGDHDGKVICEVTATVIDANDVDNSKLNVTNIKLPDSNAISKADNNGGNLDEEDFHVDADVNKDVEMRQEKEEEEKDDQNEEKDKLLNDTNIINNENKEEEEKDENIHLPVKLDSTLTQPITDNGDVMDIDNVNISEKDNVNPNENIQLENNNEEDNLDINETEKAKAAAAAKAKRFRRKSNQLLEADLANSYLNNDINNLEKPNETSNEANSSFTRSRYGRVHKTKQMNPEMVTFDAPKRRSVIKDELKNDIEENFDSGDNEIPEDENASSVVNEHEASPDSAKKKRGRKKGSISSTATTPVATTPRASSRRESKNKVYTEPDEKADEDTSTPKAVRQVKSADSAKRRRTPKAQLSEKKTIVLTTKDTDAIILDRDILTTIPEKEGDYMVGDLLWSKLPGYPWWPCMVSIDPVMRIFSKIGGTSYKAERVYHVQYFGTQPLRGYTMPGMTMPFKGREEYELNLDRVKNSPVAQKSQRSKLLAKFTIKSQFKKEWDIAVNEAEIARSMLPDDRVKKFTFEYVFSEAKKSSQQPPPPKSRKSEPTTTAHSTSVDSSAEFYTQSPPNLKKVKKTSSPEDVYDFDEDEMDDFNASNISQPPPLLLGQNRANKQVEFSVYFKQHKRSTIEQNPDLNDDEIENLLKHKWDLLSKDQKAPYVVRPKMSTTPRQPANHKPKARKVPERKSLPKEEEKSASDDEGALVIAEPQSSAKRNSRKSAPADIVKASSTPRRKRKENDEDSDINKKRKRRSNVDKISESIKEEAKPIIATTVNNLTSVSNEANSIESSDETATSEDASSVSELETTEQTKIASERICAKCFEEAKDTVQCTGKCLQSFHRHCVEVKEKEDFKCADCASGKYRCFVCGTQGNADEDVMKCNDQNCGKFYHASCLQNHYPLKKVKQDSNEFICPLHFCLTCFVEHQDDQVYRSVKKRLVKCLKCPTAYHFLDHCIAAGTVTISNSYIICPEHYEHKRSRSEKQVNVTWCFSCGTGGNLICCERCPAAFHPDCLDHGAPESSFYCGDCVSRKQLHYGDIVWVKLGQYRWWPGRVCPPKNVPDNVMNLQHTLGEFPVYFFGTHDYFWIHKGRAFLFVEGDSTKTVGNNGGSKSLSKSFKLAMAEAVEAYKLWQDAKKAVLDYKTSKPPPYVHIRSNKPFGKCQQVPNSGNKSHNKCGCEPNSSYPCSSDVGCFNRLLMLECNQQICSAGDKCCNQRFRKREYVKVVPFKTDERGWGLKTLQDTKKQQFVIEYVGELIDEEECEARLKRASESSEGNFYFLTIDKDTIIDAGPKGNLARFMNHSCNPNCETQKWEINGVTRVGLFALQDIPAGSELTFNYNLDCRGNEKTVCRCGAKNCSGFIGVRPSKAVHDDTNNGANSKRLANGNGKKRRTRKDKPSKADYDSLHEDDCFRCGEGGELVMCDKKGCPKAFHLVCLNLKEIPRGKWECPWHHCDDCGKLAAARCSYCPTSYCNEHNIEERLKEISEGQYVCTEHDAQNLSNDDATSLSVKVEDDKSIDKIIESKEMEIENQEDLKENDCEIPDEAPKDVDKQEILHEECNEKSEDVKKEQNSEKSENDTCNEDTNINKDNENNDTSASVTSSSSLLPPPSLDSSLTFKENTDAQLQEQEQQQQQQQKETMSEENA